MDGYLAGFFFSLEKLSSIEGDEFTSIQRDGTDLLIPASPCLRYPLSCLLESIKNHSVVADCLCYFWHNNG